MKIKPFELATFLFFCTTCLYFAEYKEAKSELSHTINDYKSLDSLYTWQSERLLNYTLISLEQSKIIDSFQSSRRAKENNKKLMDLQTKLD